MDPEFDPFPLHIPDEDPEPPNVLGYVWNHGPKDDHGSAALLAAAFGAPVVEPLVWPEGAGPPQYLLDPPNPVTGRRSIASYGVVAALPGHPTPIIVTGHAGAPPPWSGSRGWVEVPELGHLRGMARDDGLFGHVCLAWEEQTVWLVMFPSVGAAVTTAESLCHVDPASS